MSTFKMKHTSAVVKPKITLVPSENLSDHEDLASNLNAARKQEKEKKLEKSQSSNVKESHHNAVCDNPGSSSTVQNSNPSVHHTELHGSSCLEDSEHVLEERSSETRPNESQKEQSQQEPPEISVNHVNQDQENSLNQYEPSTARCDRGTSGLDMTGTVSSWSMDSQNVNVTVKFPISSFKKMYLAILEKEKEFLNPCGESERKEFDDEYEIISKESNDFVTLDVTPQDVQVSNDTCESNIPAGNQVDIQSVGSIPVIHVRSSTDTENIQATAANGTAECTAGSKALAETAILSTVLSDKTFDKSEETPERVGAKDSEVSAFQKKMLENVEEINIDKTTANDGCVLNAEHGNGDNIFKEIVVSENVENARINKSETEVATQVNVSSRAEAPALMHDVAVEECHKLADETSSKSSSSLVSVLSPRHEISSADDMEATYRDGIKEKTVSNNDFDKTKFSDSNMWYGIVPLINVENVQTREVQFESSTDTTKFFEIKLSSTKCALIRVSSKQNGGISVEAVKIKCPEPAVNIVVENSLNEPKVIQTNFSNTAHIQEANSEPSESCIPDCQVSPSDIVENETTPQNSHEVSQQGPSNISFQDLPQNDIQKNLSTLEDTETSQITSENLRKDATVCEASDVIVTGEIIESNRKKFSPFSSIKTVQKLDVKVIQPEQMLNISADNSSHNLEHAYSADESLTDFKETGSCSTQPPLIETSDIQGQSSSMKGDQIFDIGLPEFARNSPDKLHSNKTKRISSDDLSKVNDEQISDFNQRDIEHDVEQSKIAENSYKELTEKEHIEKFSNESLDSETVVESSGSLSIIKDVQETSKGEIVGGELSKILKIETEENFSEKLSEIPQETLRDLKIIKIEKEPSSEQMCETHSERLQQMTQYDKNKSLNSSTASEVPEKELDAPEKKLSSKDSAQPFHTTVASPKELTVNEVSTEIYPQSKTLKEGETTVISSPPKDMSGNGINRESSLPPKELAVNESVLESPLSSKELTMSDLTTESSLTSTCMELSSPLEDLEENKTTVVSWKERSLGESSMESLISKDLTVTGLIEKSLQSEDLVKCKTISESALESAVAFLNLTISEKETDDSLPESIDSEKFQKTHDDLIKSKTVSDAQHKHEVMIKHQQENSSHASGGKFYELENTVLEESCKKDEVSKETNITLENTGSTVVVEDSLVSIQAFEKTGSEELQKSVSPDRISDEKEKKVTLSENDVKLSEDVTCQEASEDFSTDKLRDDSMGIENALSGVPTEKNETLSECSAVSNYLNSSEETKPYQQECSKYISRSSVSESLGDATGDLDKKSEENGVAVSLETEKSRKVDSHRSVEEKIAKDYSAESDINNNIFRETEQTMEGDSSQPLKEKIEEANSATISPEKKESNKENCNQPLEERINKVISTVISLETENSEGTDSNRLIKEKFGKVNSAAVSLETEKTKEVDSLRSVAEKIGKDYSVESDINNNIYRETEQTMEGDSSPPLEEKIEEVNNAIISPENEDSNKDCNRPVQEVIAKVISAIISLETENSDGTDSNQLVKEKFGKVNSAANSLETEKSKEVESHQSEEEKISKDYSAESDVSSDTTSRETEQTKGDSSQPVEEKIEEINSDTISPENEESNKKDCNRPVGEMIDKVISAVISLETENSDGTDSNQLVKEKFDKVNSAADSLETEKSKEVDSHQSEEEKISKDYSAESDVSCDTTSRETDQTKEGEYSQPVEEKIEEVNSETVSPENEESNKDCNQPAEEMIDKVINAVTSLETENSEKTDSNESVEKINDKVEQIMDSKPENSKNIKAVTNDDKETKNEILRNELSDEAANIDIKNLSDDSKSIDKEQQETNGKLDAKEVLEESQNLSEEETSRGTRNISLRKTSRSDTSQTEHRAEPSNIPSKSATSNIPKDQKLNISRNIKKGKSAMPEKYANKPQIMDETDSAPVARRTRVKNISAPLSKDVTSENQPVASESLEVKKPSVQSGEESAENVSLVKRALRSSKPVGSNTPLKENKPARLSADSQKTSTAPTESNTRFIRAGTPDRKLMENVLIPPRSSPRKGKGRSGTSQAESRAGPSSTPSTSGARSNRNSSESKNSEASSSSTRKKKK